MKKSTILMTAIALLTLLTTACTPKVLSPLQDGSYSVTFDDFDSTGWKAFMVLEVENSTITHVEYDYIGTPENGGILKSQDLSYAEAMFSVAGTKPQLYISQLETDLIESQDPDKVDVVTGATTSTKDFKHFASIAIEASRKGDTTPIIVPQNE